MATLIGSSEKPPADSGTTLGLRHLQCGTAVPRWPRFGSVWAFTRSDSPGCAARWNCSPGRTGSGECARVVVLDQGPVQDVWSVVVKGDLPSEGAIKRALRGAVAGAGLSFAFVYFDIGVDAALERIATRPATKCRFDVMQVDEARRLLATHDEHLRSILACAQDVSGAPCFQVDAARPPEELSEEVAEFVNSVAFWQWNNASSGRKPEWTREQA